MGNAESKEKQQRQQAENTQKASSETPPPALPAPQFASDADVRVAVANGGVVVDLRGIDEGKSKGDLVTDSLKVRPSTRPSVRGEVFASTLLLVCLGDTSPSSLVCLR